MPNYIARYRWKKAIRKVVRNNKWSNIKDAIAFEKYTGNHGPYWQRLPSKNLSRNNTYKRKKRYHKTKYTSNDWYYKNGTWYMKLK